MIENNLKNGEENNKKIITDIKIKKEIRGCVLNWNGKYDIKIIIIMK